jgi:hypothetical protein
VPNLTDSTGTVANGDPCDPSELGNETESDPVYKNYNWIYTKGGLGIDKLTGALLKMVWTTIGSGVGKVVSPADPKRINQWYVVFTRQKQTWTLVCTCITSIDGKRTKTHSWTQKPNKDGGVQTKIIDQYAGPMLLEKALTGGDPQGNSLVNPGEISPDGDRAVHESDAQDNNEYKDK